jgi:hypothetical protein
LSCCSGGTGGSMKSVIVRCPSLNYFFNEL